MDACYEFYHDCDNLLEEDVKTIRKVAKIE